MTDLDPQPQPVTNATGWAAAVTGVVGATLTVLVATGVITPDARDQIGEALAVAIPAVVGAFATIIAGMHASSRVTPLARPRDAHGRRLVAERPAVDGSRIAAKVVPPSEVRDLPPTGPDTGTFRAQLDHDFETWKAEHFHHDDTEETRVVPEIPAVTDEPNRHIPEHVIPGKRLGRHVNHDPRSLSYLVPPTATPVTAMWTRRVPVFDQGDLGSCTGNAAAGVLGTDPFYATLPAGLTDDEKEAVSLYSAATSLDSYDGTYPPDDTGSDGLSVAKACQRAGLISGYQHITSVAAAQTAIVSGPFIVGCNWYSSMDNPNAGGLVTVSGSIRGGHEFECHGYDAEYDRWWFTNSWGESWGKSGTFCMSSASFARLLSEQGDATVFLPVVPAPTPQPPAPPAPTPPAPAPTGVTVPAEVAAEVTSWARRAIERKDDSKADKATARDWLSKVPGQ